jgi:hypothetical protein
MNQAVETTSLLPPRAAASASARTRANVVTVSGALLCVAALAAVATLTVTPPGFSSAIANTITALGDGVVQTTATSGVNATHGVPSLTSVAAAPLGGYAYPSRHNT